MRGHRSHSHLKMASVVVPYCSVLFFSSSQKSRLTKRGKGKCSPVFIRMKWTTMSSWFLLSCTHWRPKNVTVSLSLFLLILKKRDRHARQRHGIYLSYTHADGMKEKSERSSRPRRLLLLLCCPATDSCGSRCMFPSSPFKQQSISLLLHLDSHFGSDWL